MRIAVVNWTRRLAGGAEATLAAPLPEFVAAGHELGLWHEVDHPEDRAAFPLPDGTVTWSVAALGASAALAALRAWRPDVLLAHGMLDAELERRIADVAPGVFFAHNYYGTCISGTKTFTFPRIRPCAEPFGWGCVLRYYPRRTGGVSPLTLTRAFRTQRQRLGTLRRFRALAVLSEHMRAEYVRHGFAPARVVHLPPPRLTLRPDPGLEQAGAARASAPPAPCSLLFVSRMDPLKGGAPLLHAAVRVAALINRPVDITLAGDGPARRAWEALASRLARDEPRLRARFPGWVAHDRLPALFAGAHLLVLPSLWPEPFGRIGLEAAAFGLPAVAFAVGGIPDWLSDGANGQLAPGAPPTVDGLADAIARAVRDPDHYEALRRGARAAARQLDPAAHATALLVLLDRAAGANGTAALA